MVGNTVGIIPKVNPKKSRGKNCTAKNTGKGGGYSWGGDSKRRSYTKVEQKKFTPKSRPSRRGEWYEQKGMKQEGEGANLSCAPKTGSA